ncbi:MAG: cellulose synthase operon protein YhjQ/BcsQ [Terricaulis sp.]
MTQKLASAAPRTTRAVKAAAPTVLLDADEPCLSAIEAEEDIFVVEQAAAQPMRPTPASAFADVAPPPFDDAVDDEPPFDAPDPDDEVFQVRRQTLDLDAGDAVDCESPIEQAAPSVQGPPRAPAISIHISYERADADALLTAFASDPRLARTEITAARGGIEAAHTRFGKMPSPDLLVLDTALGPRALLEELDPLLLRLDPRTRIIVIGDANDVGLVRDLARRGIAYYLLAPKPENVITRVCELYATHDSARIIAVVGARGGAGASTMAQNLAWSIAERQHATTALVDLDLSFGLAGFDFEERGAQSMGVGFLAPDLVDDAFLDRACVKHGAKLSIYAVAPSVAQPFDLEAEAVRRVIARVRRTAEFVVLDVPHHWAAWVREVLVAADEVMIVATPDLASLRNAKNLMERLKEARKGSEPLYMLSMTGAAKTLEISVRDFTEAMGAKPVESMEFDPALFGMAAIKSKSIGAMAPRSKAGMAIEALAWVLTGREPGIRAKTKDVLARVAAPVAPEETTAHAAPQAAESAPEPVLQPAPLPAPRTRETDLARKPVRARRGYERSYAAASRQKSPPQRSSGAIRAVLTLAALALACLGSLQNRDLVHAIAQASGVLH